MRAVGYVCASSDDRPPEVRADVRERLGVLLPGAGIETQRAAIADACSSRRWTLEEVFVDDRDGGERGRTGYAAARTELEQGRADVLVAAKLDTACSWPELPDLLDCSEREGWDFMALDLGLDTLTDDGRSALRSLGSRARALPRSGLAIPPAELMFRVIGHDSPWRFEVGGRLELEEIDSVMSAHGRKVGDFSDILDFGCGPGRLLRQLHAMAPHASLWGVDQDEDAVAWVRRKLPFVQTAVARPLPPLPLAAGAFDLVIVFSVFTHLDEAYQDAWLAELRRLTRPGGFVVATVHGNGKWEEIRNGHMTREPRLESMAAKFASRGFLHWRGDDWGAFFPDYYHTSFHRDDYIRERWGRWFDVVDVVEPRHSGPGHHLLFSGHDTVLLRARKPARRGGLLGRSYRRLRR